jgi:hypothetical protein
MSAANTMSVTIQDDWAVGSSQIVSFPTGQRVSIVVPPGVRPGQIIQVQAPQAAAPPPAESGVRLQIMVPAGCAPGSRVEFKLPDGRSMNAVVPPGVRPGQMFTVVATQPPGTAPPPASIPLPAPEPAPAPQIAPPPVGGVSGGTSAPEISIRHSASGARSVEIVTLREGFLQKQGHIRKSWKKRWFVLKSDGTMPYYKNESSATKDEEPLGVVMIGADGLNVSGGEAESSAAGRSCAFRLHQPGGTVREYVLAGSDQAETDAWINTIERRYQLQREYELGLKKDTCSGAFLLSSSLPPLLF